MSFLSVVPEMVTAAAGNLEDIRSALTAANAAVATPTTGVAPPGADAVSAAIATVFGTHGQQYQSLGAQLSAFHERFVGTLNAGISQYLGTDAASARQNVVTSVNTPALLERSAIRVAAAEASFASAIGSPDFGIGSVAKAGIAVSGDAGSAPAVTTPLTTPLTTTPVTAPPVGPGPVIPPVTPPASPPPTGTPATLPVLNYSTPLGQVQLALTGTVDPSTGFTLQSGSLVLPSPIVLAIDALGAPYNAYLALGSSGPAFLGDLQTGNLAGALGIVAHAPGDVWNSFLYGQQSLTVSAPAPDGSGLSQVSVSIPTDGLLVHAADSAMVSATPTGGGSPMAVALSGAQFDGLVPALQQFGGGLPTSMQAVAGHALPLLGGPGDGPFTATVFDQPTPFGEVSLSLSGTVSGGQLMLTGGSLVAPQSVMLAVDALGAPYNAYVALGASGPALVNAVQTGNVAGALGIVAHAPLDDVWHSFLYGQQTLTVSEPDGSGLSQVGVNIPMDGLLVHGASPVTVSVTPTGGAPTVVALTGAQISGLGPALQQFAGLPTSMQAVGGHALPLLGGPGDGPFTATVFDQPTPFGEVSLSLSGTVSGGQLMLTGGSLVAPQSVMLAVDALGAPYNAYVALGASGPALVNAVQTGNVAGALGIVAHAPLDDVWHSFLYGQQTLTVSEPDGSGLSQVGVNIPMDGLLVHGASPVTVSVTPTGGSPTVVALSGAQITGLGPALQQFGGGLPTSMQAVAGHGLNALPGFTVGSDGSFSGTVFDQPTPFGEVSLSLSGMVDPVTGAVSLQGASAVVPQPVMLAVDALGAPYNAYVALGPGGPALVSAVQTGNYAGALGILAHAPLDDVWHSFLYGQQTLTVSEPGDGSAFSQVGVSIPMDGLLVHGPDSAMVSATPTGGGSPQVVTVSGAQINGLVPALQQFGGGLPTSMQAVAGHALNALPGFTVGSDGSFSGTVFDQPTPFGEVSLSLSGMVDPVTGAVSLQGASAVVPQPVMLAVDALGAPYNAYVALGPGGPALVSAVQTGNYAGALGILAHAPLDDVWHSFLYGQQSLTVSEPGDGSAFSQVGVSIPMDGLLVHGPDSAMVSATPTGGGSPQVVTVSGAQINGLIPALQQFAGLPTSMQAVAGHALPLLGLPPDGSFNVQVFDQPTPFGDVELSLSGTVSMGQLTLTGASLAAPPQLALAVDALGAPYDAYLALGSDGPAFVGDLQSGNVLGAVNILAHSPGDVWNSFLYGQQTLTLAEPTPSDSGFSQVSVSIPTDGLLVHGADEATVTVTPTSGPPSVAPLTGAEFGGLIAALEDAGVLPVM